MEAHMELSSVLHFHIYTWNVNFITSAIAFEHVLGLPLPWRLHRVFAFGWRGAFPAPAARIPAYPTFLYARLSTPPTPLPPHTTPPRHTPGRIGLCMIHAPGQPLLRWPLLQHNLQHAARHLPAAPCTLQTCLPCNLL